MRNKLLLIILSLFSCTLEAQVTANAGTDRSICINDTLKVSGSGLSVNDTGSYQWKDVSSNIIVSNFSFLKIKITNANSSIYELTVTKKAYNGTFISKDSFTLQVNALPTFKYNSTTSRCYDQGCLDLTASNTAVAMPGNISGLRYFQKNKQPSWITSSSPYTYCSKLPNTQLPLTGLRDTICYDYSDNNGCYNYECKPIRLYPNPIIQLNSAITCQANGTYELGQLVTEPISGNRVGGIETFRVIEVPAGSGVNKNTLITINTKVNPYLYFLDLGKKNEPQKLGIYQFEYCFKNSLTGCQRCDTANVKVVRLPKIQFDSLPSYCMNGLPVHLDSFVRDSFNKKHLSGGNWECVAFGGSRNVQNSQVKNAIDNGVLQKKYFIPTTGPGSYLLRYTNNTVGCTISDSLTIVVNGLPQIKLYAPDTICANSGLFNLTTNYALNDTNGFWIGKHIQGHYINSDKFNLGNSYAVREKSYFIYTNPLTKCSNIDSISTTVIKKPQFKFNFSQQANSKYLIDFNITDSNMNLNNLNWLWYFGNGDTSTQKYPKNIFYKDSGEYKAYLSIGNDICNVWDSITFKLNKVISHINSINRIVNLYPNPTNGELNITAPIDGELKLFNLEGKLLLIQSVNANQLNTLNLTHLSEGIYFVSIGNIELQYWTKVIKNK